jgi:ELWxxDGT repeat protein
MLVRFSTELNRHGTDPYAWWCGRGGAARRPSIPIPDVGAILVADINPVGGSDPNGLLLVGDSLFFAAYNGRSAELWMYEQTGGARQISSFGPHPAGATANMTAINETVYINASDAEHGQELWAYDETNGTRLVLEIIPGNSGTYLLHMTGVNEQLIFSAYDGVHGSEPWVYDPTTGVGKLFDLYSGSRGSDPGEFLVIDDKVYFVARDFVLGEELFVYDSGCVLP